MNGLRRVDRLAMPAVSVQAQDRAADAVGGRRRDERGRVVAADDREQRAGGPSGRVASHELLVWSQRGARIGRGV